MDFAFDATTLELRERLLAFMDECVYPAEPRFREEVERSADPLGHAARDRGAQGAGARARPVEPVPAADPRARRRADQPAVRAAGRDHGPQPVDRAGGAQLLGARHRQHGAALAVRHAGAEGALARSAARRADPVGVLDDRARGRLLGRDEHRDADRARRRRLRHQRAQVVDVGRDVAALRAADRHGRHRPRRRAPPAPEHDPGAEGHAGRARSCARRACSATTTGRTAATPRSSTTTSACRPRTCSARRARASGSRRSGSGPGASTTRCGRSGWPSARSRCCAGGPPRGRRSGARSSTTASSSTGSPRRG